MRSFEFMTSARIVFGPGQAGRLGELAEGLGARVLLVLGGSSAEASGLATRLRGLLALAAEATCDREPTAEIVERAVHAGREGRCDVVVGVGGGAVLDCAKAASAMLTNPGRLEDYLEGPAGSRALELPPLPVLAVPTTAGTGSEVTKNAVISGPGYKKSLRSPMMIPRLAVVDPELTLGAPSSVTASCGMDALTQLVESYCSRSAGPLTDALALEGVRAAGRSLARVVAEPEDRDARHDMALASLLGGVCLANAGLGAVHGIAAALGALAGLPHGLACAALLPQVVGANLRATAGSPAGERLRGRVARLGEALASEPGKDEDEAVETCLRILDRLQRELDVPRLGALGVRPADLPRLVGGSRGSSMRYNPAELTDEQIEAVLRACL